MRLRDGVGWLLLAVAFGVFTKLGLLFLAPPENVSYFWPASGFLLALLALTPPKRWLRIMLVLFPFGVLLNAWGTGRGVLPSIGFALADVLEAWPAAWLLLRFGGPTLDFGSVRQVVALVLAAAPASAILSGAVGAAVATRVGSAAGFFTTFRTWAISVLVSNILITPLIVTWGRAARGRAAVREMAEAALIVVLLAAVTTFVFAGPAPGGLPLFYLPFPFVFWAALRLGPRGASMASLTVAVIAVLLSVRGMTNFAPASSTAVRVHWMQLLIGTMAVSALALAAAVEEQRSTAARLREAEARHRVIVEAAPIGVALTDGSGAIVHANPAFATLLGRGVAELIGRRFVEFTYAEDRPSNVEVLQELVSGKREFVSFEKRYVRPDGSVIPTQL
ncbi:MAG: MASE1 domain-containing protein, partial [Polyangiales bacterium]